MRAIFPLIHGEPKQVIIDIDEFQIDFRVCDLIDQDLGESQIKHLAEREMRIPFDLENGPLIRLRIFRVSKMESVFLFSIHHILIDGWSMKVLVDDLRKFYEHLEQGKARPNDSLEYQYRDFVYWQIDEVRKQSMNKHKAYWAEQLDHLPPSLSLPAYQSKSPSYSYNGYGGSVRFSIEDEVTSWLRSFSNDEGVTMFMTLKAAFNVFLYRLGGQKDIIVGTDISGRTRQEFQNQIGYFTNLLPVRKVLDDQQTFSEFVQGVKETITAAFVHQEYPYDLILSDKISSGADVDLPLFDVLFLYQNFDHNLGFSELFNDIEVTPIMLDTQNSMVDLQFEFVEQPSELFFNITYNPDLYGRDQMTIIGGYFQNLLKELSTGKNKIINDYHLLTESDRNKILNEFNQNTAHYSEESIVDLFEKQVLLTPHNIAVSYLSQNLTYDTLNKKSNQLATYLANELASKKDQKVGIAMSRSDKWIIALLGLLKAGFIYVPIDPSLPRERMAFMMENSEVAVLITEEESQLGDDSIPHILFDNELENKLLNLPSNNLQLPINLDQIAYEIYTSGSTGRPKGVMIEHGSLMDYVVTFSDYFSVKPQDKVIQQASISFDTTVEEIFPILIHGGELIIVEDNRDIEELCNTIHRCSATILSTTPLVLNEINSFKRPLVSLRTIISGGDALKSSHIDYLFKHHPIYNTYGPTESTVCACFHQVTSLKNAHHIGKPIANRRIYILDHDLNVLPMGCTGEIYIGGKGVARGYVNGHSDVQKVFIDNPFIENEKLYKSGDLGQIQPDGSVIFKGRKDRQVKIRGNRVEVDEVENAIMTDKSIDEAAVKVFNEDGLNYLVAYFHPKNSQDIDLRGFLLKSLPAYMVPQHFVEVTSLPKTNSGKVDYKQLPIPSKNNTPGKARYIAPKNDLERKLIYLFEEVLSYRPIGTQDNFFEIGGHSLKATSLLSKIQQHFTVSLKTRDIVNNPSVIELANVLSDHKIQPVDVISRVEQQSYYSASLAQKRIWVLQNLNNTKAFNLTWAYKIKGDFKPEALEFAFEKIIERHEILRTRFKVIDDELKQIIDPFETSRQVIDIQKLHRKHQRPISEILNDFIDESFDLENGPLIKAKLVRASDNDFLFMLGIHHIITDGWSVEVMVKEIIRLYGLNAPNSTDILRTLPFQYKDFVAWYNKSRTMTQIETEKQFWMKELQLPLPKLNLSKPALTSPVQRLKGRTIRHHFAPGMLRSLRTFGNEQGATLFMSLMTISKLLFHKYTGLNDLVIATDTSGRGHFALEDQMGHFINTVVLRTIIDPSENSYALLERVKNKILSCFEHQDYPFDFLVHDLGLQNDYSGTPIFDVLIVLQNFDNKRKFEELDTDLEITDLRPGPIDSIVDLHFEFLEQNDQLSLMIRYNSDVYEEPQIKNFISHFERLTSLILDQPSEPIANLDMLSSIEEGRLLADLKGPDRKYSFDTITALFENNLLSKANLTSVNFNSHFVTYQQFNAKSNRLANYLRDNHIIHTGMKVCLAMERSEDMLYGMFAILKSGGAFVPIDSQLPLERVNHMVDDSGATIVLTDTKTFDKIGSVLSTGVLIYEELENELITYSTGNLTPIHAPSDPAYIIYTSGSTGLPKGVMVSHRAMTDYVQTFINYFKLTSDDVVIQQSSISFDVCIEEIFPALCVGAELIILPEGGHNISDLLDICEKNLVSVLSTTPLVVNELNQQFDKLQSLRVLISGGDTLKPHYIDKLIDHVPIYNTYGPTESTVCALYHKVTGPEDISLIGKPISNRQVYVLDENQRMTPRYVPGEIYLGGNGLSVGYLNRIEETSFRFIENPYQPGELLYRTGDQAIVREDGNVEFIGRNDFQVKVRGYRIELQEIERILQKHESVEEVVVLIHNQGSEGERLVTFYTSNTNENILLREFLSRYLPQYMIPSHFFLLDELPLNISGKVDRQRLKNSKNLPQAESQYLEPSTSDEKKLARIWEEVIKKSPIGLLDNFFELGGHSLTAAQIVSQIKRQLYRDIEYRDIFENPTVKGLAQVIFKLREVELQTIAPIEEQFFYKVSHGQNRFLILDQLAQHGEVYNIPLVYEIKGALNREALQSAIIGLIDEHESLRTSFHSVRGSYKQVVKDSLDITEVLSYKDLLSEGASEHEVQNVIMDEISKPFDLQNDPLIRIKLLLFEQEKHIFIITIHHIISDGWSMGVLARKVITGYADYVKGRPNLPKPQRLQYKDFSKWQNSLLTQGKLNKHREYWVNKMSGEIPKLDLILDKPRPTIKTYKGAYSTFKFDTETSMRIEHFAQSRSSSLFMILLSFLKVLLFRYTNQDDIIVGSPVASRDLPELEDQIGFYVNTLALRTKLNPSQGFDQLVNSVKATCLEAYEHQLYPFDCLVDDLGLDRDLSRTPLFDVMLVLHDDNFIGNDLLHSDGLDIAEMDRHLSVSKFDLTLSFYKEENILKCKIEYNNDIFSEKSIDRLIAHHFKLVDSIIKSPECSIDQLEYLSKNDADQLLNKFNPLYQDASEVPSFIEMFESRVKQTPDALALTFGESKWTFEELDAHANKIAFNLSETSIHENGFVVGIFLDRSEWIVISIIGVLKAGRTYVPLDPTYPTARTNYIVEDSALKILITSKSYTDKLSSIPSILTLEDMLARPDKKTSGPKPEQPSNELSHIIYTSGSTGAPKGVMVSNSNVSTLLHWAFKEFGNSKFDIVYAVTSYCFDLSVYEIMFPLSIGKSVRILESPDQIGQFLSVDFNVLLNTVPSIIETLLKSKVDMSNVSVLNMAGEVIPSYVINNLDCERMEVRNLYGPSEDTTYSTCYQIENADKLVTIGKPIFNTRVYIMDENHNLVPIGVKGELYISGDGVSIGYLNKPDL
ncbi:MAG: amino acid adenylation domain-containing protein, partial [Bacteroidota bacterium]